MEITAGALFVAVAVLLDSIELISSAEPEQTTFTQLFPEYRQNGYLPPVRKMLRNLEIISSTAFTQVGNHILRRPDHHCPFLTRGHIIFAWAAYDGSSDTDRENEYIAPLWKLFPSLEHKERWVFDTTHNHWVTLDQDEFDKLGYGYFYELVQVQEIVALRHRLTTGNPTVDTRAHHTAFLRANEETNMLQGTEAERMNGGQAYFLHSARLIAKRYMDVYDVVFRQIARNSGYHNCRRF